MPVHFRPMPFLFEFGGSDSPRRLRVVAVPSVPRWFDGIACFSFLNRFTYGNFGDPARFGLEC